MTRATTRAERHVRRESVMEPWLGYCRECRQTWPCLYEQGQRDAQEAAAERVAALPIWSLHYYSGIPLIRQADAVAAIKGDSDDGS
jgi:hypothetical protein